MTIRDDSHGSSGRRRPVSARWWLLALLAYTAGTLLWLGRSGPGGPAATAGTGAGGTALPAVPLDLKRARTMLARVSAQDAAQAVFSIPITAEALERTEQYGFAVLPRKEEGRCAVQVIAECDHHFSYSHVYPNVEFSRQGFTFVAPLTGAAATAYWSPIDHPGAWTAWERGGMRRLAVKVFARAALHDAVVLHYQPVQAAGPAETRLAWAQVLASPVPLGARWELAFDVTGWNGNPFDYKALPLALDVVPPEGAALRILPFLHQNFEAVSGLKGETIRPRGPKHFLARYRPGVTGRHAYRLLVRAADGQERALEAGTFDVTAGTPPDFLRISRRSPRFFEHADGRFFYPIGWNIPYPVDRPYGQDYVPYLPDEKSLAFMEKLLDDLAAAGGNFTRLWMSDWWNGLEWNRNVDNFGGIGRYNLKNAWLNDQIMAHCERLGIRLQLETLTHVSLKDDYGWPGHPYNVANGGFLRRPDDFWDDPRTTALSGNRLRYIVARYADSPAIHSWNIMSEPDILGVYRWPQARPFILSQLRAIQQMDPYGHLTGNQLCMSDRDPAFFLEKAVQFVSANAYAGGIAGLPEDQIAAIRGFSERYSGHDRPLMVAETAGHFAGDPAFKMRRDTLGALWSGVAGSLAGTPLSWWWNFNYGEELGGGYRVVADFMRGEDLAAEDAAEKGGWRNRAVACTSPDGNARALMAGNATRRFLFLYNFDTLSRTRALATRCNASAVTFGGLTPGRYVAEYWDVQAGKSTHVQEVSVDDSGAAELHPPEFTQGWAVKIQTGVGSNSPYGDFTRLDDTEVVPPVSENSSAPDPTATERAATERVATERATNDAAGDWSWRIVPQVGVEFPAAAERTMIDVRIGLPDVCRHRFPRVTDADGAPVPFTWQSLGEGSAWRLLLARAPQALPLTVTAATEEQAAEQPALDEATRGLRVTVAAGVFPWLQTSELFDQHFAGTPNKRQARVSVVDQVENPVGGNENFLALYQGPLLIPAEGVYAFAANSDDGCFVKIDGQLVVAWPAAHDMELRDRPAGNTWSHRGTMTLKRGLHWLEYYHQQGRGAGLARLGWNPPRTEGVDANALAPPFSEPHATPFRVVPAWALDGRIPCAVEVRHKDRVLLTLRPCLGLELRRPRTRMAVAAVEEDGRRRYEYFEGEGLRSVEAGNRRVPIWAWNSGRQEFSVDWEVCTDGSAPFLKTLLYDMDAPLSAQIGGRPSAEQPHSARRWIAWPLTDQDQRAAFTLSLGGVPLVHGNLGRWPAVTVAPLSGNPADLALTHLIEVGTVKTGAALPGRRLAAWWRGAPPEVITPAWLRMDPWTDDPDDLSRALGEGRGDTGVLLRLDRRAIVQGWSGKQVYARLHAVLQAIRRAAAVPVLVLNPEVDINNPATQDMALAFHRLSNEFGCPFVDLREE